MSKNEKEYYSIEWRRGEFTVKLIKGAFHWFRICSKWIVNSRVCSTYYVLYTVCNANFPPQRRLSMSAYFNTYIERFYTGFMTSSILDFIPPKLRFF